MSTDLICSFRNWKSVL